MDSVDLVGAEGIEGDVKLTGLVASCRSDPETGKPLRPAMPTAKESPTGCRTTSVNPDRTEDPEVERDRGVDVGRLDAYVVEHGRRLEPSADERARSGDAPNLARCRSASDGDEEPARGGRRAQPNGEGLSLVGGHRDHEMTLCAASVRQHSPAGSIRREPTTGDDQQLTWTSGENR